MILNHSKAMQVAMEVVNEHAGSIMRDLGIENENISIDLSPLARQDGPGTLAGYICGECSSQIRKTSTFMFGPIIATQLIEANITIYVGSITTLLSLTKTPLWRFSRIAFEKYVLETLAHELRHAYQDVDVQWANKKYSPLTQSLARLDFNYYQAASYEVDARNYAKEYVGPSRLTKILKRCIETIKKTTTR